MINLEEELLLLKQKRRQLDPKKLIKELVKIIGYHPDALTMYGDLRLIDADMIQELRNRGVSGRVLADKILKEMVIETPNSQELSIKIFGYNKKITPSSLDNYIDQVTDRVKLQKEITENQKRLQEKDLDDLVQEEDMALGELEEFW